VAGRKNREAGVDEDALDLSDDRDVDDEDLEEVDAEASFDDHEVEDEVTDDVEALEGDEEEESDDRAAGDEDEDTDQASLDELLAQRAAARWGTEDSDDESEIMALSSEAKSQAKESRATRVTPVRARQEFVCKRCHLVKPRVQLADAQRGLCRDCA
jgi:Domain of unknown function (DUF4193)